MPVVVTLDGVLVAQGVVAKDLARRIGLSETQLSLIRSGKVRGLRFETIAKLCAALGCKPGDLLDYRFDPAELNPGLSAEDEA